MTRVVFRRAPRRSGRKKEDDGDRRHVGGAVRFGDGAVTPRSRRRASRRRVAKRASSCAASEVASALPPLTNRLFSLSLSLLLSVSPSLLLSFSPSLLRSFAPLLLLSFAPSIFRSFAPSLLLSVALSLPGDRSIGLTSCGAARGPLRVSEGGGARQRRHRHHETAAAAPAPELGRYGAARARVLVVVARRLGRCVRGCSPPPDDVIRKCGMFGPAFSSSSSLGGLDGALLGFDDITPKMMPSGSVGVDRRVIRRRRRSVDWTVRGWGSMISPENDDIGECWRRQKSDTSPSSLGGLDGAWLGSR